MTYDHEILRILAEAGERGLSIGKIARHVHHACNSLFNPIDFEDVHAYVGQYLIRNSKRTDALVEKTDQRGIYRLNPDSSEMRQLMLQFMDEQPDDNKNTKAVQDLSLPLFDF